MEDVKRGTRRLGCGSESPGKAGWQVHLPWAGPLWAVCEEGIPAPLGSESGLSRSPLPPATAHTQPLSPGQHFGMVTLQTWDWVAWVRPCPIASVGKPLPLRVFLCRVQVITGWAHRIPSGAPGACLSQYPSSQQDGSEETGASVMQKTPIILSKPPAERVSGGRGKEPPGRVGREHLGQGSPPLTEPA